jgi:hypothetical protein
MSPDVLQLLDRARLRQPAKTRARQAQESSSNFGVVKTSAAVLTAKEPQKIMESEFGMQCNAYGSEKCFVTGTR